MRILGFHIFCVRDDHERVLEERLAKAELDRDTNLWCFNEVLTHNDELRKRIEELETQNMRLIHHLGYTGREVVGLRAFFPTAIGDEADWRAWEDELL